MAGDRSPPAFLFFAADWLADAEVRSMSLAARGAYIDMMAFAWREGDIPADISRLARLLGCATDEFAPIFEEVRCCWVPGKAGRLVNLRLEEERTKLKRKHKRLSAAGRRGAEKRWKQEELDSQAIDEAKAEPDVPVDNMFEQFWKLYPKRSGGNPKRPAQKRWEAILKQGTAIPEDLIAAAEMYAAYCRATKREGSEFVMQAQTFLGPGQRWCDDWTIPRSSQERSKNDLRKVTW